MPGTVVGGAVVEITMDLAKFAEETKTQLATALDSPALKETVTAGMDKAAAGVGASGKVAADEFAAGITEGTPKIAAAAETAATEAGAASKEKMAEEGAESGAAFKDGMLDQLKGLATAAVPLLGVLAGGELLKSSVEAADQLEGANIKIENVFGESGDAVKKWAGSVSDSLRESALSAETQAGSFGAYLSGLGVGKDQAAGLSEQLVSLTANMAAFNNADPAEVQAALTSALRGRTTALKQYGVTLTAAQVNQEAMSHASELGTIAMKDGQPVLNTQQKALATLYAVMDATKNQQGALASTSDTLKAKQQVLSAEFDNFKATLGSYLLPVLASVAGFITDKFIPGVVALWGWLGPKLTPVVKAIGDIFRTTFGYITYAWQAVVQGWQNGVDRFSVSADGWIAIFIIAGAKIHEIFDDVKAIASAVISWLVDNWPAIQKIIVLFWQTIQPVLKAFGALLVTVWHTIIEPLIAWIKAHWSEISKAIEVVAIILAVAFKVLAVAITIALNTTAAIIRVAVPIIVALLRGIIGVIEQVATVVTWLWQNIVVPAFDGISAAVQLWWTVNSAIIDAFITAIEAIGSTAQKVYNDVVGWINDAVTFVTGLPGRIASIAGDMLNAGTTLAKAFFNGLGSLASTIGSDIVDDLKKAINTVVIHPINAGIKVINSDLIHNANKIPFVNIPNIPNIPDLAAGATILPTPGGTLARIAEAGKAETVTDAGQTNALIANLNKRLENLPATGFGGGDPDLVNAIMALASRPVSVQVNKREIARANANGNLSLSRGQ